MYQNDAKGNRDEDLVDDVGWTLLMRVQSGLIVGEAQSGRVRCPRCETVIPVEWGRRRGKDITLHCANCGWQRPWPEYRKTFHNKHLGLGGIHAPCEEFARQYPQARTYQEKILLIDALIHRFHWEAKGIPGAPGAALLIGGKASEIADFLDRLTYGEQTTPGLTERHHEWREIGKDRPYGPRNVENGVERK